jgi:hypothetical protein
MDTPDDLDGFLTRLLQTADDSETPSPAKIDREERAFIERVMTSVTNGSKGIFVVLHPSDQLQYILLNADRVGGIALLAKVMQRAAEALEAEAG